MKRKFNKIAMLAVASIMFAGFLLVNMETNENGNWGLPTSSAQTGGGEEGGGEIDYADSGATGQCYVVGSYMCTDGGFATTCTFTGVYGSPFTCTSAGCGIFNVWPKTRRCVQRI